METLLESGLPNILSGPLFVNGGSLFGSKMRTLEKYCLIWTEDLLKPLVCVFSRITDLIKKSPELTGMAEIRMRSIMEFLWDSSPEMGAV